MAKFCAYCGRELADGEVCTCGGQQVPPHAQTGWNSQPPSRPGWAVLALKSFWRSLTGSFRRPLGTMEDMIAQENWLGGLLFYCIHVFVLTLIGTAAVRSYTGMHSVATFWWGRMHWLGTLVMQLATVFLFWVAAHGLFLVIASAVGRVLKSQARFSQYVASLGYATWPVALAAVLALVLGGISVRVFGFLAVVCLMGSVFVFQTFAILKTSGLEQDKGFYAVLITYVAYALLMVLVGMLFY